MGGANGAGAGDRHELAEMDNGWED